jgi:hypothetical protein
MKLAFRGLDGTIIIALVLFIGLPWIGVILAGLPIELYLEFPPGSRYLVPAPFSWTVFSALAAITLLALGVPLFQIMRTGERKAISPSRYPFPIWGWLGVTCLIIGWVLAWSRFDWFAPLQRHTFVMLWASYIVIINALTMKRSGNCLLKDRPAYLTGLFFVSAIFWWYFEYLNRFVQNWHYVGIKDFTAGEYLLFATVSFSTVLPAVISTRDLLATVPRLSDGLQGLAPLRLSRPRRVAATVLVVSATALAFVALAPNHLFPILWLAPLLIVTSLQAVRGEAHLFQAVSEGNWQHLWLAALAALVCGFFWEMWNYFSLAHWTYAVPFVQRFHLFEMPLLGYAGYLPFGAVCVVVALLVPGKTRY